MRKLRSSDRRCVHRSEDSRSTSKHLALCSALQQGWKVIRMDGKMDADTFRPSWEEKLVESAKAPRLAWSSTFQHDNHPLTGSQRCHGNVPGMQRHSQSPDRSPDRSPESVLFINVFGPAWWSVWGCVPTSVCSHSSSPAPVSVSILC